MTTFSNVINSSRLYERYTTHQHWTFRYSIFNFPVVKVSIGGWERVISFQPGMLVCRCHERCILLAALLLKKNPTRIYDEEVFCAHVHVISKPDKTSNFLFQHSRFKIELVMAMIFSMCEAYHYWESMYFNMYLYHQWYV